MPLEALEHLQTNGKLPITAQQRHAGRKNVKNKNIPAKIKNKQPDQRFVTLIALFQKNTGTQKQPRYYSTHCNSQINADLAFYAVKK